MKELLKSSEIFPILAAVGFIYFVLSFCLAANKKLQILGERAVLFFYIFLMPQLTINPFLRLHPHYITTGQFKLSSVYALLTMVFYPSVAIVLNSRFRDFFQNFLLLFYNPFIAGILILALFSSFWSIVPADTFKSALVLLCVSAIAAHIAKRYSWKEISSLLRWSTTAIATLSTYYALMVPSVGASGKGWQGVMEHPNRLGSIMAVSMALWAMHATVDKKQRWVSIGIVFWLFYIINNTNSSTSKILFFALFFLVFLVRYLKNFSFRVVFPILIIYMLLAAGVTLWITQNYEFFIVDILGKDLTLTGRTELWGRLNHSIAEYPWLGYGFKGFWLRGLGILEDPAGNIINANGFKPNSAHSGFYDVVLELGLVGLVLFFLSFFLNLIRSTLNMRDSKQLESVLPILIMTYMAIANLTVSNLVSIHFIWFSYVIISVRLGIETMGQLKQTPPQIWGSESKQPTKNSEMQRVR